MVDLASSCPNSVEPRANAQSAGALVSIVSYHRGIRHLLAFALECATTASVSDWRYKQSTIDMEAARSTGDNKAAVLRLVAPR
jgi:hypothetical protein